VERRYHQRADMYADDSPEKQKFARGELRKRKFTYLKNFRTLSGIVRGNGERGKELTRKRSWAGCQHKKSPSSTWPEG